jgi:hypothetical protein
VQAETGSTQSVDWLPDRIRAGFGDHRDKLGAMSSVGAALDLRWQDVEETESEWIWYLCNSSRGQGNGK